MGSGSSWLWCTMLLWACGLLVRVAAVSEEDCTPATNQCPVLIGVTSQTQGMLIDLRLGLTPVADGDGNGQPFCNTLGCFHPQAGTPFPSEYKIRVRVCAEEPPDTLQENSTCPNSNNCQRQATDTGTFWCNSEETFEPVSESITANANGDVLNNWRMLQQPIAQGLLTNASWYTISLIKTQRADDTNVGNWSYPLRVKAIGPPQAAIEAESIVSLQGRDRGIVLTVLPSTEYGLGADITDVWYEALVYDVSKWYDFHISHFGTQKDQFQQPLPLDWPRDEHPFDAEHVYSSIGTRDAKEVNSGQSIFIQNLQNNVTYAVAVFMRNSGGRSPSPAYYSKKVFPDECWEWSGGAGAVIKGVGGPQLLAAGDPAIITMSQLQRQKQQNTDESAHESLRAEPLLFFPEVSDPLTQATYSFHQRGASARVQVMFSAKNANLSFPAVEAARVKAAAAVEAGAPLLVAAEQSDKTSLVSAEADEILKQIGVWRLPCTSNSSDPYFQSFTACERWAGTAAAINEALQHGVAFTILPINDLPPPDMSLGPSTNCTNNTGCNMSHKDPGCGSNRPVASFSVTVVAEMPTCLTGITYHSATLDQFAWLQSIYNGVNQSASSTYSNTPPPPSPSLYGNATFDAGDYAAASSKPSQFSSSPNHIQTESWSQSPVAETTLIIQSTICAPENETEQQQPWPSTVTAFASSSSAPSSPQIAPETNGGSWDPFVGASYFAPFDDFETLNNRSLLYMYRPNDWTNPYNFAWQGDFRLEDPSVIHLINPNPD